MEIAEGLNDIQLYALCHPDHPASARVLEKCGFRLEQRLEQFAEFPNLNPGRREACLRYVREEAAPGQSLGVYQNPDRMSLQIMYANQATAWEGFQHA